MKNKLISAFILPIILGWGSVCYAANDGLTGENSLVDTGPRIATVGSTCLNFDDLSTGPLPSPYGTVTFSNSNYPLEVSSDYPGPVFTSPNSVRTTTFTNNGVFMATFASPVSEVTVTMGDYNADADTIYLEAYNSANVLVASDSDLVPASLSGGIDLSVSASDIAYVKFSSTGTFNGSVFFDNLCFSETNSGPFTPACGDTLTTETQTFSWASVPGATNYWVWLGANSPAGIHNSGILPAAQTSVTVNNIPISGFNDWNQPVGSTVTMRLWYKVAQEWLHEDCQYNLPQ